METTEWYIIKKEKVKPEYMGPEYMGLTHSHHNLGFCSSHTNILVFPNSIAQIDFRAEAIAKEENQELATFGMKGSDKSYKGKIVQGVNRERIKAAISKLSERRGEVTNRELLEEILIDLAV